MAIEVAKVSEAQLALFLQAGALSGLLSLKKALHAAGGAAGRPLSPSESLQVSIEEMKEELVGVPDGVSPEQAALFAAMDKAIDRTILVLKQVRASKPKTQNPQP